MSNSKLVSFARISPNRTSPRTHTIDTVTIHCTAGQLSVEQLGDIFASVERGASSNYGIGTDGRVGMYVEESDRSWCSSNAVNDDRAVTIEVASGKYHPYAVSNKAYAALVELLTDICRRNGIKRLVWSESKNDRVNHLGGCNMTVHRDYANKACPGEWLYSRHREIAQAVNAKLTPPKTKSEEINDFVWELAERGIVTDKALWLKKAENDVNVYWLMKKFIAFIEKHNI